MALLIILSDSLITFINIHLEYYAQSIVIIIYDDQKEVNEYQSFHWNSDFEKNIVISRAITWLLDQAIKHISKGDNRREDNSQNIISTFS